MTTLSALAGERAQEDNPHPQRGPNGDDERVGKRNRVTVSISNKSLNAVREIRDLTDADSDSEVFRNALRLYLTLLRGQQDGKIVYLRDEKQGTVYPIELFLPVK